MLVFCKTLECMHLEPVLFQMCLQNVLAVMALYGLADAHGVFSLNDIQFWALMNKFTDLPLETIYTYFFRLDVDYTGEMNFIEFQLFCSWMIAAKDKVTKEFLHRHFEMFVSIMETGKRKNYVPLYDFVKIGQVMGWNLGTMDRLYKFWDRNFESERYRVKLDFVMTFIIFAIDHERATTSRQRIMALKEWKKRWFRNLEHVILEYLVHDALPAPPLIWSQIVTTNPPFVKVMKEIEEEKGLCEYCVRIYCTFVCLPWVIGCGAMYILWSHSERFRNSVKWFLGLLICKPCWPFFGLLHQKCSLSADDPSVRRFPAYSTEFYYRNKKKQREKPMFQYLQKQREQDGLFHRIDPWQNNWLKTQLHLEKLEKQLLNNRIKFREANKLRLKDTWGTSGIHAANYISKQGRRISRYKTRIDLPFHPAPPTETKLVIDPEDILKASYPSRFLDNFSVQEILTAENEVRTREDNVTKGAKRKGADLIFNRLRETVGGLARRRKKPVEPKSLPKPEVEVEERKKTSLPTIRKKLKEKLEKKQKEMKEIQLKEEAERARRRKEEAEFARRLMEEAEEALAMDEGKAVRKKWEVEKEKDEGRHSKDESGKGRHSKHEPEKGQNLKREKENAEKLKKYVMTIQEAKEEADKRKKPTELKGRKSKAEVGNWQKSKQGVGKGQKPEAEVKKKQKLSERAGKNKKKSSEGEGKDQKPKEESGKGQKSTQEVGKGQKSKPDVGKGEKPKQDVGKGHKPEDGVGTSQKTKQATEKGQK